MSTIMHLSKFQFHIGAINSNSCGCYLPAKTYFNSTLVRLTGAYARSSSLAFFNFNSTLVRLTGIFLFCLWWWLYKFQFHIGAINRKPFVPPPVVVSYFNSTLVRLTAPARIIFSLVYWDFNSTLVRLTVLPDSVVSACKSNFNSTLVRLTAPCSLAPAQHWQISIPHWCD